MDLNAYHSTRLVADRRRDVLWSTLARYLQRFVAETDAVLDFGAGHCGFINNVRAARRLAFDQWHGVVDHAETGVESIVGEYQGLEQLPASSLNVVFASNVFEHFTVAELLDVVRVLRRLLKPDGRLMLLQPNFHYAYRQYFDDYTHKSIWTHVSLADFLSANGFELIDVRKAFLPLTVKSRLPVYPFLIRAYLASPFKPMAGQMLLVARPRA
jgi:SAM-dependent methyltransferase